MSALPKIKLLINLARIDGQVAELERNYIINIGRANNLSEAEVTPLFDQVHDIIVPSDLDHRERFDYIFKLVTLMKIDSKLYGEEIRYCARVASHLGYDQQVLFDLMLHARTTAMTGDEITTLQELTRKYLSGKKS